VTLRVEVQAYRHDLDMRFALNTLSFLNVTRNGRVSNRAQSAMELVLPYGADEITGLRLAILQLKESLPAGALVGALRFLRAGGISSVC
jgi:hypothetical protein